jgi:beta-glucosidase
MTAKQRHLRLLGLSTLLVSVPLATYAQQNPPAKAAGFRDLNHDGKLNPYENPALTPERRIADLIARMTIEEKVGTMLHGSLPNNDPPGQNGNGYDLSATTRMIEAGHITSFITRLTVPPKTMAEQNNAVQSLAEHSRLGIPVTISTDPRNHFQAVLGASTTGGGFSLWPETLGFAALRDPARVRRFGDIARREYRAVGIQMALSPQADLATEPRWPRGTATFGSNPALVSQLAGAYVEGFQGGKDGVHKDGVATVVKHWVGYGAEPEGFDGHNYYGRIARLDSASFARHVAAFDGALAARTAGIMPTYPILSGVTIEGKPLEPVGAGFNAQLLDGQLRKQKGFGGLVLSDWAITNDCSESCRAPTAEHPQKIADIGMPWGVETLTPQQRFAKGANAGIDQFGGVNDPAALLAAVRAGDVSQARVDQAVRRILLLKFKLGLFDNPYVVVDAAVRIAGNAATQAEADVAQRQAQVVLENKGGVLPIRPVSRKVWLYGIDNKAAEAAGFTVVAAPEQADLAILRIATPFERLHPNHFFGSRQNEGRLDFRDGTADYEAIKRASSAVTTIVAIDLDRPAILTNVRDHVQALVATFGASDAAVLDVLTGRAQAKGRLPFELPSSMSAVEQQDPARSDDSAAPLYPYGAGLTVGR